MLTLVIALLMAAPGSADAGARGPDSRQARAGMLQLLNNSRRHHGVKPLRINWKLSTFAWRHSRRMAKHHTLYHSADVWDQVNDYGATSWGENVGLAGTLRRVQRLFMASSVHRANILSSGFHRVGVGVVTARGRLWVTLDFYG